MNPLSKIENYNNTKILSDCVSFSGLDSDLQALLGTIQYTNALEMDNRALELDNKLKRDLIFKQERELIELRQKLKELEKFYGI